MNDRDLNQSELAEMLGCAPNKINEIVNGKRSVTPEFALQLEEKFGLSANVWSRMQAEYDVWAARQEQENDEAEKAKVARKYHPRSAAKRYA
jgi:addiction module HigA family antidote